MQLVEVVFVFHAELVVLRVELLPTTIEVNHINSQLHLVVGCKSVNVIVS